MGAVAAVAITGLTVAGSAVATALSAPSTTQASTTAARKNVELTWTPVTGATAYEIQLLDDDNIDVAKHMEATSPFARWTVPVTLPTGEYRWRVRGLSGTTPGPWSALTTLERGWEQATSTSPADLAGGSLPTLRWAPMPDASFYEVEVSPVSFLSPQYSASDDGFICRTEHTTFTPYAVSLGGTDFANPPGDESSCAFVAQSPAQEAAATATPSPSPTPTPSATPAAEKVVGKYVYGKTYFWRVRGRDGTVDTRTTPFTASPGSCLSPWLVSGVKVEQSTAGGSTVTYQLPLTPPKMGPTPECSLWSAEKTFVPQEPSLQLVDSAPTDLLAGPLASGSTSRVSASPTFSWSPVAGAIFYRFYFSRDRLVGSVDFSAETLGTSITPVSSLVLGSTTRYWAVQACGVGRTSAGDAECGPISAPQPITQVTTNPAAPRSLTAMPGYLSATWTTGSADRSPAKAYEVRVTDTRTGASTTTTTDRVAADLDSGVSTLVVPASSMVEGAYAFDVRPVDESGHPFPWSTRSAAAVVDHAAPTARITTASGVADRSPVTLELSEPVHGVSPATFGVKDPSGAHLAGALRRIDDTHVRFTPTAPWVTGSTLRAWSASSVLDRAGKSVVASAGVVRVSTVADDRGSALVFRQGDRPWSARSSSDAYRGGYRSTWDDPRTTARPSATLLVHGTRVDVTVCKTPTSGTLRVYVDGVLRTTASLRRSWTGCGDLVRVTGLASGTHRVVLMGVASNGLGTVGIDRVSAG